MKFPKVPNLIADDGLIFERASIFDDMPEGGFVFPRPLPDTAEEFWGKSVNEFAAGIPDALGPEWVNRWSVREDLIPKLEYDHSNGDRSAALGALFFCIAFDLPIPRWAKVSFLSTCIAIERGETANWDDAFGQMHPKGTHIASSTRRDQLRREVYRDVCLASAAGHPVDAALFEEVGAKFGIKKTLASELYYAEKKWHSEF